MEENRFYKNIWRFNALIIAAAGVLSIVVLLFVLYTLYRESNQTIRRSEIVNIDPEKNIKEVFRLGNLEHINGSKTVITRLYSDQNFSLNYAASKSTASTRNILFSNLYNQTNRWLLPNNKFLISEYQYIKEGNLYDKNNTVLAILYSVVKNDSNNDSRLSSSDKITVSLSTPDGRGYTEIIENTERVLGYKVLDETSIAIMHNRDGKGYSIFVKLSDFTILKEVEFPKFN